MDETGFPAAVDVLKGFIPCYLTSEPGVDSQRGISKKKAAVIYWVILAPGGLAADTGVHDPMDIGALDEMFHHLRWQNNFIWHLYLLVDEDCLILRQVKQVIVFK
jgi:hypothetical protein